jgi:hypothetical protein
LKNCATRKVASGWSCAHDGSNVPERVPIIIPLLLENVSGNGTAERVACFLLTIYMKGEATCLQNL